jgi:transcriptional regulator with XRE-family HTH domain
MDDRNEPAAELDPAPSLLLGDRLRRYRRQLGWTQAQLAERAAVNKSTVSAIERGTERPLHRTARALADALGLSVERLLGLGGQPVLFPLADERRVELVRRLVTLDDDSIEEAWAGVRRVLDRVERKGRRRTAAAAGGRPAKKESRD